MNRRSFIREAGTSGLLISFLAYYSMTGAFHGYAEAAESLPGKGNGQQLLNSLTSKEKAEGWQLLFNGKDLSGWKSYKSDQVKPNWIIDEGTLTCSGKGGDILTKGKFADFDLRLEWKIVPGGNSGILFRSSEDTKLIWHNSIEMQVLDTSIKKKPKKKKSNQKKGPSPMTSAGACYALYPTDMTAIRKAGEWNTVRIFAEGKHVRFWLNGKQTADFKIGSEDWKSRVQKSKFNKYPGFAMNTEGYVALQSHGSQVWYRNIKIKEF